MIKITLIIIFIIGLLYILAPTPSSVNDFPPLPNSLKSNEPGDTYQVPNIAAYFSQFDRKGIGEFYRQKMQEKFFWGFLFPPATLNYPPKYAYTYLRDQLYVTFLEEYVYPLKGSIFVAGYEPYIDNEILKRNHTFIGDHIHINGQYFVSKTILRLYPASIFAALIVYLGIWLALAALYLIFKNILQERAK